MEKDKLQGADEEVFTQVVKGRGKKGNFPNSRAGLITTDEDRQFVSKLLGEVLVEYQKEKVKSDEELAERINDYFLRCAQSGQIPTVEEMCLTTGFSQSAIWDWETGRRPGLGEMSNDIIKKAKHVLKTFDAKLVVSGKLNFLAYCFRAKNYYDMTDKNELVLTPNTQPDDYDAEAIRQRYMLDSGEAEVKE